MNKSRKNTIALLWVLFFALSFSEGKSQDHPKLKVYNSHEEMVAAAKEVIKEISVADFKKIYNNKKPVVIDIRTQKEYDAGSIPGAVHIPRGVLEFKIHKEESWSGSGFSPPEKSEPVFLFCRTGGRGSLATKSLMQLGYTNIHSIQGGWEAWQEAHPELSE